MTLNLNHFFFYMNRNGKFEQTSGRMKWHFPRETQLERFKPLSSSPFCIVATAGPNKPFGSTGTQRRCVFSL